MVWKDTRMLSVIHGWVMMYPEKCAIFPTAFYTSNVSLGSEGFLVAFSNPH